MIAMTYVSGSFLLFFGAFLLLYLLMPKALPRQLVILAGNILFYIFAGGRSLLAIIFATAIWTWLCSLLMARVYAGFTAEAEGLKPKEKNQLLAIYKKRARKIMIPGIIIPLLILIWGKAGRLVGFPEAPGFSVLLSHGFRAVMVPLGISYYTLSAVGYLLDIYWRKAEAEKNPLLVLTAMTYFPTIVQGPICRYDKVMKQMKELPGFSYERVTFGLQRMIWGFFKKMVLADRITVFTTTVFSDIGSYAGFEVVIAVILNAFHLYMDFSGCMDIVIGAAETMGVALPENFSQPFFAKGAAEFWRRWHITLGNWFKDYVYMPIATNPSMMKRTNAIRKAKGKRVAGFAATAFPLMIVWILTGLWHGTGLDYVIWGLYWGILIIIESTFAPEFKKVTELLHINPESFGHRLFQMVRTFVYFSIGRMITALGTAGSVIAVFRRIFAEARPWVLFDGSLYTHGLDLPDFGVILAGIVLVWIVSILQVKSGETVRERIARQVLPLRWIVYLVGILAVVIFGMYGPGYSAAAFVYGGF